MAGLRSVLPLQQLLPHLLNGVAGIEIGMRQSASVIASSSPNV